MKIYILRPTEISTTSDPCDPWDPWYDKAFGFVVNAENEQKARKLADINAGDENRDTRHPWLDEKYTTCIELIASETEEVIIIDFHSA